MRELRRYWKCCYLYSITLIIQQRAAPIQWVPLFAEWVPGNSSCQPKPVPLFQFAITLFEPVTMLDCSVLPVEVLWLAVGSSLYDWRVKACLKHYSDEFVAVLVGLLFLDFSFVGKFQIQKKRNACMRASIERNTNTLRFTCFLMVVIVWRCISKALGLKG